jgi:D-amino-acid oxidase
LIELPTSSTMNTMTEAPQVEVQELESYHVLGAGIIGLTTALVLAQEGHDVSVHSREGKPTETADTASGNACGQFLPWVPAEHAEALLDGVSLEEVTELSRNRYGKLAEAPHETGVMKISNVELLLKDGEWPKDLPEAMRAHRDVLDDTIPFSEPDGTTADCNIALTFDTFSINTRKTIAYLADQAEQAGVRFTKQTISPEDLEGLDGVVINAMGVGAPELDNAAESKNFKGHTFVIRPEQGYMPTQALSVEDLIILPREDGTIVCGALYIADPERPVPEQAEAEELFERLGKLISAVADSGIVEGLKPDLLEHAEVLRHSAGYRVELSEGGIRIAPDEDNQRLLHAYGFGGIGWSVGPHFAQKIAEEARKLHSTLNLKKGDT